VTKFPILAALAAFVLAMPASAQPLPEGAAGSLAERLLAVHNRELALVGRRPCSGTQASPRDEKRLLEPGLLPAVSRTGRWADVAHYTQMVWPTTTRVGCAIFAADWDYLICRYSPPGYIGGKPIFAAASLAAR
jgi:Cysteine-rich secretory protein family